LKKLNSFYGKISQKPMSIRNLEKNCQTVRKGVKHEVDRWKGFVDHVSFESEVE